MFGVFARRPFAVEECLSGEVAVEFVCEFDSDVVEDVLDEFVHILLSFASDLINISDMITPSVKDALLHKLVEGDTFRKQFDLVQLSGEIGIGTDALDALLRHFESLGLCRVQRFIGGRFDVMLNVEAHDMALHGGFVAQEEHLRDSLKKLELELESLRPTFPERAARISGIMADIGTVLGLFLPFK